jgi:lysophospholipase L1-like esterase
LRWLFVFRLCALLACSSSKAPVMLHSAADDPAGEPVATRTDASGDAPQHSDNPGDAPQHGDEHSDNPGDAPLASFYTALQRLARGEADKVRVLHYGDSHTAADVLTSVVRRSLQARFGDGGRGFLPLGRPWNSFLPKDISHQAQGTWSVARVLAAAPPERMDGHYGLGGLSTIGGVGSSTRIAALPGQQTGLFEVFYLNQPGGGRFRIWVDGVAQGAVDTASETMTPGFYRVDMPAKARVFEVRTQQPPVRFFGAVIEHAGPGVVYDTLGINGSFFYTSAHWNADELQQQVQRRDPQLIVAMYGSNEANSRSLTPDTYADKVHAAMARLTAGAPRAACLLIGPPDRVLRNCGREDQLDWIIDVQRRVAAERGCGFIDLQHLMGGPGSHRQWQQQQPPLAQADGVHLTIRGYLQLGEAVARELLEGFDAFAAPSPRTEPAQDVP